MLLCAKYREFRLTTHSSVSKRTFYNSHPGTGGVATRNLRLAVAQIRTSLCKNSMSAFLDVSRSRDPQPHERIVILLINGRIKLNPLTQPILTK